MTTSKLPEWPEKPDVYGTTHDWLNYHALVTYAALARMEALVEELQDLAAVTLPQKDERYVRIHDLLATCARKEAGR